jgi:hypothetical protein
VFLFEGVFLAPEVSAQGALAEALRQPALSPALWTWVPAFCCALRDLGRPLGDRVADELETLLAGLPPGVPDQELEFGPVPDLEAPDTDLAALIDYLGTPCRCGFFLSAAVLEGMGRTLGVPRGFGPRTRLLRQLLMGASRFDRMPELLGAVEAVAARHHARLGEAPYLAPAASAAVGPWRTRLALSIHLLQAMAARLSEGAVVVPVAASR